MGMYDSIHVNNFPCPNCGKIVESMEFQTKCLHNAMDHYQFPDVLHEGVELEDNCFDVHGSCPHCRKYMMGYMDVEDEVIYRFKFRNTKTKKFIKREIPLFPELKGILKNLQKTKEERRDYRAAVQALLFSVYNGDELNEEKALRVDEELKLNVLRDVTPYIGRKFPLETFFLGPLSRFYALLHLKKDKK